MGLYRYKQAQMLICLLCVCLRTGCAVILVGSKFGLVTLTANHEASVSEQSTLQNGPVG